MPKLSPLGLHQNGPRKAQLPTENPCSTHMGMFTGVLPAGARTRRWQSKVLH